MQMKYFINFFHIFNIFAHRPHVSRVFLTIWQWIELALIAVASAPLILMYLFSEAKNIGFALSILWIGFLLKLIVVLFFFKKKQWTVLFNIVQDLAVIGFLIYAVFYIFFYGDISHYMAVIQMLALIIGIGVLYFIIVKKFYGYYIYLRRMK